MRAKTINEDNNFERGLDPKDAMGIGGIVLEDKYFDMVVKAKQKWNKYLGTFVGKTVSVYLDPDRYASVTTSNERKTIKVTDVSSDQYGRVNFQNENGTTYFIDTAKQIYIK